jgi:hypothetical protein
MAKTSKRINVYIEKGQKRTFAGAIHWPGWCRSGPDEASALQELFDYGPRYAQVLRAKEFAFRAPKNLSALNVIERMKGDATTDFGAPSLAPSADAEPVNDKELQRFRAILKACWRFFDATTKSASGKELRKGPRGGGRELDGIIEHLLGSDVGYLGGLGSKVKLDESAESNEELKRVRKSILEALIASAHGKIAERGPRGGIRWKPRYFVRRVAWHVLDHAWEIEDRIVKRAKTD